MNVNLDQHKLTFHNYSEFCALKDVLLCPPRFMKIRKIINETQKYFADENINTAAAVSQHNQLIEVLEKHQIRTHLLEADAMLPEQVFTRDIGFTIGRQFFIARMKKQIRQGETEPLKRWLDQHHLEACEIKEGYIEGGDIIVHGDTVFAGQSDRTTVEGIKELQLLLPDKTIVPIRFDESYLHLDCVFQPISKKEALAFPAAIHDEDLEKLLQRFSLIAISEEEQFTLGTNVLSIGNKKIVSLPVNASVNEQLRSRGYEIIEVDISEIIKSGGSFRCITLPLCRHSINH